jgi:hypothetical protein
VPERRNGDAKPETGESSAAQRLICSLRKQASNGGIELSVMARWIVLAQE